MRTVLGLGSDQLSRDAQRVIELPATASRCQWDTRRFLSLADTDGKELLSYHVLFLLLPMCAADDPQESTCAPLMTLGAYMNMGIFIGAYMDQ